MLDDSLDNKLRHQVGCWVKNLGIRYACDHTKRLAVAISQVASELPIDPDLGCDKLHEVQSTLVRKREQTPSPTTMKQFWKDPNEFWKRFPSAYTETHPPVSCCIDDDKLAEYNLSDAIPTRNRHKKIKR